LRGGSVEEWTNALLRRDQLAIYMPPTHRRSSVLMSESTMSLMATDMWGIVRQPFSVTEQGTAHACVLDCVQRRQSWVKVVLRKQIYFNIKADNVSCPKNRQLTLSTNKLRTSVVQTGWHGGEGMANTAPGFSCWANTLNISWASPSPEMITTAS
jgi:hypothetical protein